MLAVLLMEIFTAATVTATPSLPIHITHSLLCGLFDGIVLQASLLSGQPFPPPDVILLPGGELPGSARLVARFDGVSDAVSIGTSVDVVIDISRPRETGRWVGFEVNHRPAWERSWCAPARGEACRSLAERAGALLSSHAGQALSLLSNIFRRGLLFSSLFLNSTVVGISVGAGLVLHLDGRLSTSPLPSTALLPTSAFFAKPFPLLFFTPTSLHPLSIPSSFARCRFGAVTPSASLWAITLPHLGPAGVPGLATAGSLRAALTPGSGQNVRLRAVVAPHPAAAAHRDLIELSFPDLRVQFTEEENREEPVFSLSCSIQSALLPLTAGPDGAPRVGAPVEPPTLIWSPRSSAVGTIDMGVLGLMTPLLINFSNAFFKYLASEQAARLIEANATPAVVCNRL